MPEYSVNRNPQPTGGHEVHADRCPAWPVDNISLGWHHDCHSAVRDARIYFADCRRLCDLLRRLPRALTTRSDSRGR
jgi:hypothetical protein